MLPFVSLDAATSIGPGQAKDLESVRGQHTMIVSMTGLPVSNALTALEGSHDGSTWLQLASVTWSSGAEFPDKIITASQSVRHVRANVKTLTGGTSPTITATIASS